ncbi:hypothetical protein [Halopseudomonas salegens]|uniref:Phage terminase large subunit-like protein n=1 Tax=Halopseudomonas salegens TaxID=1434072 RepID=A0A1H2HBJ3_9GAMM|nr:hypothetical protein [Halopseudomonas salegens]SDU29261.1 hypothetical protein SAMN05216210_2923 [Halopseudomonas salegens]
MITIRDLMTDSALFGDQFAGDSFTAWRALLGGFYGLELDAIEAEAFHTLTDRQPPTVALNELWLVIGRRGGKSAAAALLAVFEAVFNDHRDKLAPGEVATVMVIAADRKQARAVMRYVRGLLAHPMLTRYVVRDQAESIELANRCAIEVMTASHRSTRGYTAACVICDEIAFWYSDGANPDREILNAVRPSLATLGGKLIALSSPYARRGVLWNAYKRQYGKEGSVLVAQAPSRLMNPTLPESVVQEAYADDPVSAAAEYGAEFRTDVESFVSVEAVDACTRPGQVELPPATGMTYTAFVDPSGGVADAFTLAIGHRDGNTAVIDCARAIKPPFSPEAVVAEYCALLKSYRVSRVTGDAYAGEWPREQFRKHGIQYDKSSRNRSELYRDLLPLLNSGQVELPPLPVLHQQLVGLERRTSRGGRDSIDHAPGGHDDLANAVAGCAVHIGTRNTYDLSAWADGFSFPT